MSNQCPYVYGYSQLTTSRQSESQIAQEKVRETFGTQNIAALLVPKGDYDSEKALLNRLEQYDQIDYAMGLSNIEAMDGYTLTDALTPRQFEEMTDLDYEVVCLLYTAYAAQNENYGQIVGGIDDYTVPLMDMFLFAYDQEEAGYFSLEEDATEELNDMYQQLTDARDQMLGTHYMGPGDHRDGKRDARERRVHERVRHRREREQRADGKQAVAVLESPIGLPCAERERGRQRQHRHDAQGRGLPHIAEPEEGEGVTEGGRQLPPDEEREAYGGKDVGQAQIIGRPCLG